MKRLVNPGFAIFVTVLGAILFSVLNVPLGPLIAAGVGLTVLVILEK